MLVSNYHNPKELIGETKELNAWILYGHKTLADYIKAFVKNGFKIIDVNAPIPTEEQSKMSSRVACPKKIPMSLFIELEK